MKRFLPQKEVKMRHFDKFIMLVTLFFCLKMSYVIATQTTTTTTTGQEFDIISSRPSAASGHMTAEFWTDADQFVPFGPSVTSTDNNTDNNKLQTVSLTNQTFKSKVAKLKNGTIKVKRTGTFHVIIVAHHASPIAADFVGDTAELKHQLTINGRLVPNSTAQTVWSVKPSGDNRHIAHISTHCTTYLKEGDEVSVTISGSAQAGVIRTAPVGTSTLVSLEEVVTPAPAKKRCE